MGLKESFQCAMHVWWLYWFFLSFSLSSLGLSLSLSPPFPLSTLPLPFDPCAASSYTPHPHPPLSSCYPIRPLPLCCGHWLLFSKSTNESVENSGPFFSIFITIYHNIGARQALNEPPQCRVLKAIECSHQSEGSVVCDIVRSSINGLLHLSGAFSSLSPSAGKFISIKAFHEMWHVVYVMHLGCSLKSAQRFHEYNMSGPICTLLFGFPPTSVPLADLGTIANEVIERKPNGAFVGGKTKTTS